MKKEMYPYRGVIFFIILCSLLTTACTKEEDDDIEKKETEEETLTGKLAFVSYDDGDGEIYVMNADGTDLVRLTNNLANDVQPSWSPDNKKIVFMRSYYNIRVIDVENGNETILTDGLIDSSPSWSSYFTK